MVGRFWLDASGPAAAATMLQRLHQNSPTGTRGAVKLSAFEPPRARTGLPKGCSWDRQRRYSPRLCHGDRSFKCNHWMLLQLLFETFKLCPGPVSGADPTWRLSRAQILHQTRVLTIVSDCLRRRQVHSAGAGRQDSGPRLTFSSQRGAWRKSHFSH